MRKHLKRLLVVGVALALLLGLSAAGQAIDIDDFTTDIFKSQMGYGGGWMYIQPDTPYWPDEYEYRPEVVREFFPDPDVEITSPFFLDVDREQFTTHGELMEFIDYIKGESDSVQSRIIGQSQEGREIPLLIFSEDGLVHPTDLQAQDKPIVWLHASVHGDEVESTEGLLAVAHDLATTEWGAEMLEDVNVLIMPRANPDGAYYFQRATSNQIDINRDHMKLTLPEARAMHNAYNEYMPHVAVDNHTLGGWADEEWLEEFHIWHTTADAYTLSPRNANVPSEIIEVGDNLFRYNIEKTLAEKDLRHTDYIIGRRIEDNEPVANTGGYIGVIGRNAMGLVPSFSFLLETSGQGIADDRYRRRVYTQKLVNKDIIETAANHSAYVLDIIEGAREETARLGAEVCEDDTIAVTQEREPYTQEWEFIDVKKGEIIEKELTIYDHPVPDLERVRPYAYIFPPGYHDIAERLKFGGAEVRRLNESVELDLEALELVDKEVADSYYEGHFRKDVEMEKFEVEDFFFPQGSYVVKMDQPFGHGIAELMEPEASASFVRYNFIPLGERGDVYPVFRLMDDESNLNTHIVESIPDFKEFRYDRSIFFEDPR